MTESGALSGATQPQTGDGMAGAVPAVPGRYRLHQPTARTRTVKVLYGEEEMAAVCRAAAQAGLRPSGYVATVAVAQATGQMSPASAGPDRELLAELLQARLAVQLSRAHLEQLAAAGQTALSQTPMSLREALTEADRAVARLDELAGRLSRRLA